MLPEDAAYHRFLWKREGSGELATYQMNRLPFGDKCSPFVAIATTQRVADDHGTENPEAVRAIKENMYSILQKIPNAIFFCENHLLA